MPEGNRPPQHVGDDPSFRSAEESEITSSIFVEGHLEE